jgi:hypothetical protein
MRCDDFNLIPEMLILVVGLSATPMRLLVIFRFALGGIVMECTV